MKAVTVRRAGYWGMVSLSLLLASVVAVGSASGQGQETESPKAKAEKKLTGRLPAYYGEVVSNDQRAKIYEIQGKYGDQVLKLRDQILELEKQMQLDVEAVLTSEQRDQVAKRTAEAKAKRSRTGPATTGGDVKPE